VETVDIYVVRLDRPESELRRLYGLLSDEERARAGASPFSPRKRRYVTRQGALREILGRHAGVPPARLKLARTDRGKPLIAGGDGPRFSVSDSGDLALVAVARREVGVDVEQVRRRRAAPLGDREFFERWTRREATGKAHGTGLARLPASDRAVSCAALDVGRGFAAAVAVAGQGLEPRLRTY
jgi:4'-phosphopantetheinyl transferase